MHRDDEVRWGMSICRAACARVVACALIVLFVARPLPTQAMSNEAALALKTRDFVNARILLESEALRGDIEAQAQLGLLHARGRGGAKDEALAVSWFRKAAEAGSPLAQYRLGLAYAGGLGVSTDDGQALEWYLRAARQRTLPGTAPRARAPRSAAGGS